MRQEANFNSSSGRRRVIIFSPADWIAHPQSSLAQAGRKETDAEHLERDARGLERAQITMLLLAAEE